MLIKERPQVVYHKQEVGLHYHDSNLEGVHPPANVELANATYMTLSSHHQSWHRIVVQ